MIKLLAAMVTKDGEFPHPVDLSHPELTIMVEVVKVTGLTMHSGPWCAVQCVHTYMYPTTCTHSIIIVLHYKVSLFFVGSD